MIHQVYADTGFWIALLNERDDLSSIAWSLWDYIELNRLKVITSEAVLIELLDHFVRIFDGQVLASIATYIGELSQDEHVTIVRHTEHDFAEALAKFRQYAEQRVTMVDCLSFVFMKNMRITHALTYDEHYWIEGISPCLRYPHCLDSSL